RDHSIAVSTEYEGSYVFDADFEFLGDEGAEAGGIEYTGHADDALTRKAADFVGGLGHGVERVRDDYEDAVRRVVHDLADHVGHNVGVGGVGIVVGTDDRRIAFLDRHGLQQVETFALRDAFNDVDENDIG